MNTNPKKLFIPDERNLGGRRSLVYEHYNHKNSVFNIKPVINTEKILIEQLALRKGSNLDKPLHKKIREFHEVYETFRRVECVKRGYTNSIDPPQTYFMARRGDECKKLFRKKLNDIQDKGNQTQLMGSSTLSFKVSPKKWRTNTSQGFYTPQIKKKQHNQHKLNQNEIKWRQIFETVPINQELNEDNLAECKAQIVDVILRHRLYKEQDFETVNEIFAYKNQHIDKQIIDSIFEEIASAFNE